MQRNTLDLFDHVLNDSIEGIAREGELGSLPDAEIIAASDKTALPGIIDGHVHISWGTDAKPEWDEVIGDEEKMLLWEADGTLDCDEAVVDEMAAKGTYIDLNIAPAKLADVILPDGNPLDDITALKHIDSVYRSGRLCVSQGNIVWPVDRSL